MKTFGFAGLCKDVIGYGSCRDLLVASFFCFWRKAGPMSTDLQRYKVYNLSPLLQIINITTLGGGGGRGE